MESAVPTAPPDDRPLRGALARALEIEPAAIDRIAVTSSETGRWSVRLRIETGGTGLRAPLEVELAAVHPDRRTFFEAGAIGVVHLGGEDRQAAAWLKGRAPALERSGTADWVETHLLPALRAEDPARLRALDPPRPLWHPGRPVELEALPSDHGWLRPLLRRFHGHHGDEPRTFVGDDGGVSIRYPPTPTINPFFAIFGDGFLRSGPLQGYLHALGYALDSDATLRTVPSPDTFLRRVEGLGLGADGFRPRVLFIDDLRFWQLPWLDQVSAGRIPINVATARFYRRFDALQRMGLVDRLPADRWAAHFHAFGHDMSVHVFPLHRVPVSAIRPMLDRIRAALPRPSPTHYMCPPSPLTAFFEGDISRFARDLWNEVDRPEQFEDAFRDRLQDLESALDRRFEELEGGRRFGVYLEPLSPPSSASYDPADGPPHHRPMM